MEGGQYGVTFFLNLETSTVQEDLQLWSLYVVD